MTMTITRRRAASFGASALAAPLLVPGTAEAQGAPISIALAARAPSG